MSFYNMKNIAVKMLLIKLINQFSKLNRYYVHHHVQTTKKESTEFRSLFFKNNLVVTTNMIPPVYSVFKLFNSNILTCTFSETAAMAILSI